MSSRDRFLQQLGSIERLWPRIQHALEERNCFAAFRGELSALLTSMEGLRDGDDAGDTRAELSLLLARYRVDAILEAADTVYRGHESYAVRGASLATAVRSLRALLGVDEAPPVAAFPEMHVPRAVVVGETFRVEVRTREKAPEAGAKPLFFGRKGSAPIDLEVEIVVSRGLEARGAKVAVLRVPDAADSATLVFEVVASTVGEAHVHVELRRDGVALTTLRSPVLVRSKEQAEELPFARIEAVRTATVESPPAARRGVVLRLHAAVETAEKRFWRVDLSGDESLVPSPVSDILELRADAQAMLGDLCRSMHALLPTTEPESRELRLTRLAAIFGESLLPEGVRRALLDLPEGTSLHIESDDAWAPWEAVALEGPAGAIFLGERFAVSRWLRQGSLRQTIHRGRATLVAPRRSTLDVTAERRALEAISGGDMSTLERLSEVQACWLPSEPRHGFLHFACHGTVSASRAFGADLTLDDGPIHPLDVPRRSDGPLASSCVFLNACEVGLQERTLTGHGSWAEAFLGAGATAVVAPAWSILDSAAARFVEPFYGGLAEGKTVGESARTARLATRKAGDPDRLAYAVYASPWATLAPRTEQRA